MYLLLLVSKNIQARGCILVASSPEILTHVCKVFLCDIFSLFESIIVDCSWLNISSSCMTFHYYDSSFIHILYYFCFSEKDCESAPCRYD
jgi:hypothetical protein